ncbi:MAG: hypothetical protein HOY75_39310, partial [Streptomyces sp.]|nr:hypothetical protein [Streptomyces sp.]
MVGNKRLGDREGCTASGPEGTWRDEEAALALSEARIELEWERSGGAEIVTERGGAPGGDSGGDVGDVTVPGSAVSGLAAQGTAAQGTAALDTAALGAETAATTAPDTETTATTTTATATATPDTATTATATPKTAGSGGATDSRGAATHAADSAPRQPTPHTDAELAGPTALHDHPLTGAPVVRPAQLPAAVADFTGRADAVRQLSELLTVGGGGQAVLAIAGTGGIGKTALAVHVAHAARRHFPDGQLYIDLRGAGPSPAEPEAALGAFLRSLGTPDAAIPDGAEERAALYRSALKSRRALILLDNARDAAQILPLLPGDDTGGCAALITSRTNMAGLEGSHLVDLDVMSPAEAFALFARIVGEERASVERDEVMDVLASCGFLPLAIRIAACRLASRRTWTVSVLARKLADERRRLDELRAGDLAVKASFELGYGQLEPQQARAFRLLGLADGPDISLPAAAA